MFLAHQARADSDAESPAHQTEGHTAAEAMLEEVLVTARKKSAAERAQDVPIAISVVNGDAIEASHAKDLTDIGQKLPNVHLDTEGAFPAVANYAIRGMGFNSSIASVEPTVGTFVDGMYLGENIGGSVDAHDLEAVEVLRGPQGTLFGRNVTGGAVLLRSRRPTGDFDDFLSVGFGNNGRRSVAAAIEDGLTDTLAGKVFASYAHRDGDFNNPILNRKTGEENDIFVRPILRWRPTADLDLTSIFEYGRTYGDGTMVRVLTDPTTLVYSRGYREPGPVDELIQNSAGGLALKWDQAILDGSWNVGPGKIVSITGYREVTYPASGDTDGTPAEIARGFNWVKQHQLSEELRYAAKALGDKLDYTAGIYYLQQDVIQAYNINFFGKSLLRSYGTQHDESASGFFQGDYTFAPGWSFTAGLRYNWEQKHAQAADTPHCDVNFVCVYDFTGSDTWHNVAPKVGLNWKASEDILAYVSWTEGYRSGGYNIRTTDANESPGPYDEERVRASEAGLKTQLFDKLARLNLAVFDNKYTNLQRTVVDGLTNRIENAASATIKGTEVELAVLPTRNLAITGSVGYLDARYDSYPLLFPGHPAQAIGKVPVRAPKWTSAVAATLEVPLGSAGSVTGNVSFTHSAQAPMVDNDSYWLPAFNLVDASLAWSPMGAKNFQVQIWGKNLNDAKYAFTGSPAGIFTTLYQNLPRTFGVELDYRHGH